MKIFLSHATTDKTLVRKIYEELGAAYCHFDEATFDPTGAISTEVWNSLNESTHFVLFASREALNSKWVQGELRIAFESWMRNGVRQSMVFLLDGAEIADIPDWLRIYLIIEPPTFRHILCRIQSEIDKNQRSIQTPPFFRSSELERLEQKLLLETKKMPGAVIVHGPDGSGRKELLNELYQRQFPGVARRKLLISSGAYTTESGLYRDLIGLTTIATPSEFKERFMEFDKLGAHERIASLSDAVLTATAGKQCLLLEGDVSLLDEDGVIPSWLLELFSAVSGKDYPRIAMTISRRPTKLPVNALEKLVVQDVPELSRTQSEVLFFWWLRNLGGSYVEELKNTVFEACSGSPKQLELGAKLLISEGLGSVSKIKPHVLRTLEGLSRGFLKKVAENDIAAITLSFVADAGYVTRSDLTQYIEEIGIANDAEVNEAIADCASYGFLIEDEVCLRMPDYLVRGARAIAREARVEQSLKKLWQAQSKHAASLSLDEKTSISVLNEYCLSVLRTGLNIGAIAESIILPSQCLQVARSMYEKERYTDTLALAKRAYESRAALSKDD